MTRNPELLIKAYEVAVTEGLDDEEEYETEAMLALMERDAIQELWAELTEAQRQKVREIDDILVHKRTRVADVLPNAKATDRRQWWWFLHEGPQVREQAA